MALLVFLKRAQGKTDLSLYTILQIFSITLFEKMPIPQAFTDDVYKSKITSGQLLKRTIIS